MIFASVSWVVLTCSDKNSQLPFRRKFTTKPATTAGLLGLKRSGGYKCFSTCFGISTFICMYHQWSSAGVDVAVCERGDRFGPPFFQRCRSPFETLVLSFFTVLLIILWTAPAAHLIGSEESRMYFEIKQKLFLNVPKGTPQPLYCVDKEQFKSNHFKQFTVWNGLSRRSKCSDKI